MTARNYVTESEMKFFTGNPDKYFYIEKSETYNKIKKGVAIAEFLYLKEKRGRRVIHIIEAKSSSYLCL
jgi:hypothetical protein